MNILQFADYSAPYEGNFIKSLRHLEEMLEPHRVVYLFTLNTKHQEWVKSFDNVYFLTESTMKNIAIIMKIIKKEKINLIHTHFSIMKYDLPLKIARIFSRKTLYVRHMHMIYKNKKNWLLEKFKKSVANADVEIACGSATFDAMLSAGIDKTRLYLVENGIDFSRLDKFETINSAGYNILMFGYNYHIKGVDIAIKAIEKLPNTTLNIVLAANASDVKQNIMHDFGKIPENVNFLSPREDIATYYHMNDVFVSPSREESFCYAIYEAEYCGCKVVASNIPACKKIEECFKFESENADDLAKVLEKLSNNPIENEKKERMYRYVTRNFSLNVWCKKIIKIYEENLKNY